MTTRAKVFVSAFVVAGISALALYFHTSTSTTPTLKTATRTGIVWNRIALRHTKAGHPESALRAQAIIDELQNQKLLRALISVSPRPATEGELARVHSKSYVAQVKSWSQSQEPYLQHEKWSPYHSHFVWESALTAAGGLLDLVTAVADGKLRNGFAIIRPPGHHASHDKGMGFCIFNNIAVAAADLRATHHFERIAIVDVDAHHGNGTQEIFKNESQTLYISLHQADFYPYSGNESFGSILNIPMTFQSGDAAYRARFENVVLPKLLAFRPQFILVSSGYDGHWLDPMSNLGLTLNGYAWISQQLVQVADTVSGGRIVFALEGGYDLDAIANGAANTVKALLGRHDFLDPLGPPPFQER